MITTKKGKKGKAKISAFLNSSVRTITKKYDVLDKFGFAKYVNEIREMNGDDPRYLVEGSSIYALTNGVQTSDVPEFLTGKMRFILKDIVRNLELQLQVVVIMGIIMCLRVLVTRKGLLKVLL